MNAKTKNADSFFSLNTSIDTFKGDPVRDDSNSLNTYQYYGPRLGFGVDI